MGTKTIYVGESGFSSYVRGNWHLEGLRAKQKDNVLFQHQRESHPGVEMEMCDFVMELTGTFKKPVMRLCQEGISISNLIKSRNAGLPIKLLNSKNEFHQAGQINPTYGRIFS